MGDGKKITGELINGISCSTLCLRVPSGVPGRISGSTTEAPVEGSPGDQLAVLLSDQWEADRISDRDDPSDTLHRHMAGPVKRKGEQGEGTCGQSRETGNKKEISEAEQGSSGNRSCPSAGSPCVSEVL